MLIMSTLMIAIAVVAIALECFKTGTILMLISVLLVRFSA